jgi:hypothetical protein
VGRPRWPWPPLWPCPTAKRPPAQLAALEVLRRQTRRTPDVREDGRTPRQPMLRRAPLRRDGMDDHGSRRAVRPAGVFATAPYHPLSRALKPTSTQGQRVAVAGMGGCGTTTLLPRVQAELVRARGAYRGPCPGVPVAVKAQLNTAGIRTTCGPPMFNDGVPAEDATVIAKLKAAGAVLLGKRNMTAFGTTRLSHAFDPARNPWDLGRCTGGASSGAGGVTAAWGGVVGLRPTWGRVSRHGLRSGLGSMDPLGPRAHGGRLRPHPAGHRRARAPRRLHVGGARA